LEITADGEIPYYAVIFSVLFLIPSLVKMFFVAPNSGKSSTGLYALSSEREIKLYTHTKPHAKL
jgi:hypothetical protein